MGSVDWLMTVFFFFLCGENLLVDDYTAVLWGYNSNNNDEWGSNLIGDIMVI